MPIEEAYIISCDHITNAEGDSRNHDQFLILPGQGLKFGTEMARKRGWKIEEAADETGRTFFCKCPSCLNPQPRLSTAEKREKRKLSALKSARARLTKDFSPGKVLSTRIVIPYEHYIIPILELEGFQFEKKRALQIRALLVFGHLLNSSGRRGIVE